jgi:hypothetical protein
MWWVNNQPSTRDPIDEWHGVSSQERNELARKLLGDPRLMRCTRSDAARMLGPPDKTNRNGTEEYEWSIGQRRSGAGSSFFPYDEYLVLVFGDDGRCLRVFLRSRD